MFLLERIEVLPVVSADGSGRVVGTLSPILIFKNALLMPQFPAFDRVAPRLDPGWANNLVQLIKQLDVRRFDWPRRRQRKRAAGRNPLRQG